ncbi:cell envelope integrity protein CreD [Desulfospira joergensenii]|uniref:cell envelope integrity protein CreD n=1 Tax=Desulfospira joergensenii TaxID=53329 RepID=UPI0003B3B8CD|nr:cell envelope integrity protein CreD [Desulfospira joergensenii]
MTNNQDIVKKTANYIKRSVTLKLVAVGILILLLLIPAAMIQNLIRERQSRRDSVVQEISQKWGYSQIITGPFITIPFKSFFKDSDGKTQFNLNYLHILPETLDITGEMKPEIRYRSLFEAVLYNINLKFSGNFKLPLASQLNIDSNNILWDKAYLSLGITDLRGIQDKIVISFNKSGYDANPGLKTTDLAAAGVSTLIKPLLPNKSNSFSFDLNLNGSEQVGLIPVGESNTVKINSSWPSPSFNGSFLPATREVKKDGFSANWKILHLNRNYPQFWEGSQYKVTQSAFGVKLILTADIYQKSMRLAKYSIIFLVFTFAAFFFSEIINKQRIHPIQYILIGIAILIFYTLVLSLSEHMHFNYAYILSAASVSLIISGYAKSIIPNSRFALMIMGLLAILYGYLFIILQLEDYALILGSIGLLIILTLVMYITRKINWYDIEAVQQGNES